MIGRRLCLGLVLVLTVAADCNGGTTDHPATISESGPPGASSDNVSRIWLSDTTVPTSGADLAAAVVNFTRRTIIYGVLGTFQHLDGKSLVLR